jgi:hypothetical protein
MAPSFTIGQVAKTSGVAAKTIRYYEQIGACLYVEEVTKTPDGPSHLWFDLRRGLRGLASLGRQGRRRDDAHPPRRLKSREELDSDAANGGGNRGASAGGRRVRPRASTCTRFDEDRGAASYPSIGRLADVPHRAVQLPNAGIGLGQRPLASASSMVLIHVMVGSLIAHAGPSARRSSRPHCSR